MILVTFTSRYAWDCSLGWIFEEATMKKLLVFAVLAFFLLAHGTVTAFALYPQTDMADCGGSSR